VIAARSADKLAETQRCCLEHTSDVHTVVADVSREEDCKAVVEKAVEEFEGVDILILNAAYTDRVMMWFTEDRKPVRIHNCCDGNWHNLRLLVMPRERQVKSTEKKSCDLNQRPSEGLGI